MMCLTHLYAITATQGRTKMALFADHSRRMVELEDESFWVRKQERRQSRRVDKKWPSRHM